MAMITRTKRVRLRYALWPIQLNTIAHLPHIYIYIILTLSLGQLIVMDDKQSTLSRRI